MVRSGLARRGRHRPLARLPRRSRLLHAQRPRRRPRPSVRLPGRVDARRRPADRGRATRDLARDGRRLAGGAAPLSPRRLVLPRCGRGWHELRALGRRRPRHRPVRAVRALPARAAAHAPRPAPAADPGHGARRPRRPRGRHDLGRAAGDPTARRPAPPPRSRDVPRTRPLGRGRMAADVARQGSLEGPALAQAQVPDAPGAPRASGPGAFPRAGSSSGTPLAAAAPSGNDRDSCASGEPRRRSATSPRRRSSAGASSTSRRPHGPVSSSSP